MLLLQRILILQKKSMHDKLYILRNYVFTVKFSREKVTISQIIA